MSYLYIAHHGIKGMKWGVRRTPEQLGHFKQKRSRKVVNQKIARVHSYAYKNGATAKRKFAMADDLRKYGHNSDVAHALGDYADTYDDVKKLDRILRNIANDMEREARADQRAEQGFAQLEETLKHIDTTRVSAKDVKQVARQGYEKVVRYAGDDWGCTYDALADVFASGNITLGEEQASANERWWRDNH